MFIALVLLASFVSAIPYDYYKLDFTVVERNIVVNTRIIFDEEQFGSFDFPVPADARTIDAYVDTSAVDIVRENDQLKIPLRSTKELGVSYVTKEFLDNNNFLISFKAPDSIDNFSIQVTLPEKATLRKPMIEGQLTSASIHPLPDQALTDGRSMIFIWDKKNMVKGDEFSVFVQYKPGGVTIWHVLEGVLVVLLIYLLFGYFREWRYKQIIPKAGKKGKHVKKDEEESLSHLKDDERQIIRVLRQKEGSCEQGTLRIITNFSKAHLSRLLVELEERNMVFKEKRGKKNLVFLKKQ